MPNGSRFRGGDPVAPTENGKNGGLKGKVCFGGEKKKKALLLFQKMESRGEKTAKRGWKKEGERKGVWLGKKERPQKKYSQAGEGSVWRGRERRVPCCHIHGLWPLRNLSLDGAAGERKRGSGKGKGGGGNTSFRKGEVA